MDIETFPNQSFTWTGKYEQNVIDFKQEGCIACFAAKWLNDGSVFAYALPDYKGYKPYSYDDKALMVTLHKLLNEADVVVAHNGDRFDIKRINARFIFHRLTPPAPYKTVDTKKLAKRVAFFNSNKLDDLGTHLGEGKKIKTDFELWLGCMAGDKKAWREMIAYNKRDVELLERIYLRLRPWDKHHPNHGIYNAEAVCPKCGSTNVNFRGKQVTQTRRYERFQCQDCGGWGRLAHGHSGAEHTNA